MRTIALLMLPATIAALPSCTKKSLSAPANAPINLPGNASAYVAGVAGDTNAIVVKN
jgi:hypothetical protein